MVDRLGKAHVGDGRGQPAHIEVVGREQCFAEPRAERQDRDLLAFADDAPLADFEQLRGFGNCNAGALAARITHRARAGVILRHGVDHVRQFGFVRRRHDDHVGQGREIGHVEAAGVRRAVGTYQTGAVDGEAHRQVLDRHVMHDLVIGALQEGRIDGGERFVALCRHAGGERHGMLFGNADIEGAIGEGLGEAVDAGARRHRGGDRDDLVVDLRFLDQLRGKDVLVARRAGLGLDLRAGDDVEFLDAVVFVLGGFGGAVALALLGHDMDDDRTFGGIADVFEHRHQMFEVMAVDRANIVETQFLEQAAAAGERAEIFLGTLGRAVELVRQDLLRQHLDDFAQFKERPRRIDACQIRRQRADRRRDRHVIVVEDDDQPVARGLRVVHRLIRHAGRHRAVTDDGDALAGCARQLVGDGKAQGRRNRRRAVRGAERVVFGFAAFGEARQPAAGAQRADAVAAAGEDLVRIGLVADIPDQPVFGGVEHIVQRDSELDDAEAGAEVATGGADGIDQFGAQFIGDLAQIAVFEFAQVGRQRKCIKQRRCGALGHGWFNQMFLLAPAVARKRAFVDCCSAVAAALRAACGAAATHFDNRSFSAESCRCGSGANLL